jgi:hypothetical protein
MARLVMEPQNYSGRHYGGELCKFLSLGRDPERPFAGQHSDFRKLYIEANGAQPIGSEVTVQIFVDLQYDITVETVTKDRHGKERSPAHWYSIVREIHIALARPTVQHSNTSDSNPLTQRTQTTHSTDQHSNPENPPLTERGLQSSRLSNSGVSR